MKAHRQVYSPTPLGYRRDGDMLVPIPEELALVARIQSMHESGVSLRTIAQTLNGEGIPGKAGGRWYAATVKKILENDLYL